MFPVLRSVTGQRVPDAWVYIDESQAPHARGVEKGQPFWLGALITEQAVEGRLLDDALERLRLDPDAHGSKRDAATLDRGHFHASLDSPNAHSWICRAAAEQLDGCRFVASQWYFDRQGGGDFEGARLHRLGALTSIIEVLQDDYDAVHVRLAGRAGSFEEKDADEWPGYCRREFLASVVRLGMMPTRFPPIDAKLVDGRDPGVQLCDFVLWAVQRARPVALTLTGKRDWLDRLKLSLSGAGGAEGGPLQILQGRWGPWRRHRSIEPQDESPSVRDVAKLDHDERWRLVEGIAADLHRAMTAAPGSKRIGHLVPELTRAVAGLEAAGTAPESERDEHLQAIFVAFLLVCDTMPVYDVREAAEWNRATEQRLLAAQVLRTGTLWIPVRFSLRARDVCR